MTNRIEDVNKAIVYEIITIMGDDGLNALLTADDLLASMAVPVTQFDFTCVDKGRLNKLMLAVHNFIRKSKLSVNSYTKEGLRAKFDNLWVPTLSKEQKQEIIAGYRLVDGFDADGYAIFNVQLQLMENDFRKGPNPQV